MRDGEGDGGGSIFYQFLETKSDCITCLRSSPPRALTKRYSENVQQNLQENTHAEV